MRLLAVSLIFYDVLNILVCHALFNWFVFVVGFNFVLVHFFKASSWAYHCLELLLLWSFCLEAFCVFFASFGVFICAVLYFNLVRYYVKKKTILFWVQSQLVSHLKTIALDFSRHIVVLALCTQCGDTYKDCTKLIITWHSEEDLSLPA